MVFLGQQSNDELNDKLVDQDILHDPGQTFTLEEYEQEHEFSLDFLQKRKKGKVRVVEAPRFTVPIADTHAHLEMLHAPAHNLARCAWYGVRFICAMTDPVTDALTTLENLDAWKQLAQKLLVAHGLEGYVQAIPDIRMAMGCHPHNAKDYTPRVEREMLKALKHPCACALGEVGLDYHYDLSPRKTQREVFRRQIQLAHQTGLPLILHMREAHDEGLEILLDEGIPEAGVLLHCYNRDKHMLKPWLDVGCYVAFGGPLTFKHAEEVCDAALSVPLDRLLTETDSPYMTPEPLRGMECGPEHTIFTAAKMLEVLGVRQNKDSGEGEGAVAVNCVNHSSYNNHSEQEVLTVLYRNARSLLDRERTAWQAS